MNVCQVFYICVFFASTQALLFAEDYTKDPAFLFDQILRSTEPTEQKKIALAYLYQNLPEHNEHLKKIKLNFAKKFEEKFHVSIEDVLKPPPSPEQQPQEITQTFDPYYLIRAGIPLSILGTLYFFYQGRQRPVISEAYRQYMEAERAVRRELGPRAIGRRT